MTGEREVMERYLGALLHGEDFGASFAPDVVWTTMETGEQIRGRDAVRDHIVGMHTSSFDAHPELVRMVAGDGAALLEAVFIGRHTGTWDGLAPTGRDVRLPYAMAYDIADGQITALRAYFPMAVLRAALSESAAAGRAPAPA